MKHLDEVGETYWEHFLFAIRIGFVLFLTGILVMVHAVFPGILKNVGYDVVKHAHAILDARKNGVDLTDDDDDIDSAI